MTYRQHDYMDTSIPRWGCYFLSIIFLASSVTGKRLTRKQVYDLYWWGLQTLGRYGPLVIQLKGTVMWINDAGKLFQAALDACEPGWQGDFIGDQNHFFMDTHWYRGLKTRQWNGIALHWRRPDARGQDGTMIQRGHYTALDPRKDEAMNPDPGLLLVKPTGRYSLFYASK